MPNFELTYRAKSLKARDARDKRRDRARAEAKTSGQAAFDAGGSVASLRWWVTRRLNLGFEWSGGVIAGNESYYRPAFRAPGLPSERHPILQCFVTKLRRARHLHVGDDKASVYVTDSKLLALDAPYVEDNKICCGILRVELDSIVTIGAIEAQCQERGVPLPNIVVGWKDNGGFHHPHLIWLLHNSLPLVGRQNCRFLSLYRGVLRGLTKELLHIGADPGGLFNSHRHKNPVSPLWNSHVLAEQPYDLAFIARHVDVQVRLKTLEMMAMTIRSMTSPSADHPDFAVAAGSNRLFRKLAFWARQQVEAVKAAGGSESTFKAMVEAEANSLVVLMANTSLRSDVGISHVAAKVASWTWHAFRTSKALKPSLAGSELTARLADGGRKAAARRSIRSEEAIVAAMQRLLKDGQKPTQKMVTAESGRSEKTVRRHWHAVLICI